MEILTSRRDPSGTSQTHEKGQGGGSNSSRHRGTPCLPKDLALQWTPKTANFLPDFPFKLSNNWRSRS